MKSYVKIVGRGEQPAPIDDFVRRFPEDGPDIQILLTDRVREIVESLNEGNHIAYGIGRREFALHGEVMAVLAAPPSP